MRIFENMDVRRNNYPYHMVTNSVTKNQKANLSSTEKNNNLFPGIGAVESTESGVSKQMRSMIRSLRDASEKKSSMFEGTSKDKTNGFLELAGAPEASAEETKISKKYNYKTVASKIQQAKTSLSAGQAVLAAKRETLKIKRQISSGSGDPEELQIALTHAKRMEMVARKKKHHLELEELVKNTQKADERQDKAEDSAKDLKNALIAAEEEKISEREDEIFDERQEMLEEALDEMSANMEGISENGSLTGQDELLTSMNSKMQDALLTEMQDDLSYETVSDGFEQMQEGSSTSSDEMMSELNEMISEFGEEELEALEEKMEMLESMETVDPHMSKEDFEDLKRKHRASEDKAIVKANMEYLKDMIKHELKETEKTPVSAMKSSATLAAYVSTRRVHVDNGTAMASRRPSFDSDNTDSSHGTQAAPAISPSVSSAPVAVPSPSPSASVSIDIEV